MFYLGYADLGDKEAGDVYICQVEIEFSDVTGIEGKTFHFWTQGSVDKSWDYWRHGNVWNPDFISLTDSPENGVYTYNFSSKIIDEVVDAKTFNIGFRCDNWKSGKFRIRNAKVTKDEVLSRVSK